jgi:hypothetical protein
MATTVQRFSIVRGKVLRATALTDLGAIYALADAPTCEVVVTDGVISAALSAEIEGGEDIRDRNWNGAICVADRSPDQFVRFTVELTFCNVDPALHGLLTGSAVELDADSEIVGFRTAEGTLETNVGLEMWSGVAGVTGVYGYTLLPWVSGGHVGDMTLQNGRADFVVTGSYTRSGAQWGVGPYDVVKDGLDADSPLAVAMQDDEHHLLRYTAVAPPANAESCMTLEEAGGTRPV